MKTLTQLQKNDKHILTSNEILNFAPETLSESLVLQELVQILKDEIKKDLISTISHKLR